VGLILFVMLSVNAFRIFSKAKRIGKHERIKIICEMSMIGFAGNFVSSMFLSQAYSMLWVFFISLSTSVRELLINEPQTVQQDR